MKRLHLKIFAVFWLVVGTVSLIAISFDNSRTNRSVAIVTPATTPHSVTQRLADDLLSSIIAHDSVSLKTALAKDQSRITQFVYILDGQNEDLLHRTPPEELLLLANQLSAQNRTTQQGNNIGRLVTLTDGSEVKAITYVQKPFDVYLWVYAKHFVTWLFFVLSASAIACVWIAKWITSDLKSFQTASQRIAQGDLSTRVLPQNHYEFTEFAELAKEFDLMAERNEHLILQQQRINKEISHELRAPISRISVALALAKRQSDGRYDKELRVISNANESLKQTITNILAMPIDEQEDFNLPDIVDLVTLLKSLLVQNQKAARKKGVRFMTLFKCEEVLINTRSSILVGVFDNIVRNAIKYTKEHSSVYVKLSLLNNGSTVQVVVGDEGPGVSVADLNRIFQPFYRADQPKQQSSQQADNGCGLGLAIAHRTVALHQGNITAENRREGGLAVFVTLPVICQTYEVDDAVVTA